MITILHGDDIVSSRNLFLLEKKKYSNSEIFDAKKSNFVSLQEILNAKNLFFEDNAIFIENLFSSIKNEKDILELLKNANKNFNIFIWEGKELSKSDLSRLKNAIVKLFKLPQNLFLFLDNVRPNNPQNLTFFHNALNNTSVDLIFYMIVRQFRLLLTLSDSGSGIDEVKRLAPWQKQKLLRQVKYFTIDELKKIYKKLYELDLTIKTGESESLVSSIDFFLLDV